ncbi:S1 family peptidase [Granulicella arctica]|uniref:S1 family peptidase n=1 Tax=Granulicella arctica TaxID=940613 RepID=UPI0021E06AA1|nr:serine protease [Granulicella arctica]
MQVTAGVLVGLSCTLSWMISACQAPAQEASFHEQSAIVTITATTPLKTRIGSGAFIGPGGYILTCYHVVQDARNLVVFSAGSVSHDVTVVAYAPERDLAILRLKEVPNVVSSLHIAPGKPAHLLGSKFYVYGRIEGLQRQVIGASATDDDTVLANDLALDDAPKTNSALRIIPMNIGAVKGMSGGPVLSANGVIGVVAGTIPGQATLSWAIPVWGLKINEMRQIRLTPDKVSWLPLGTRFSSALNVDFEVPSSIAGTELNFVQAFDEAQSEYRHFVIVLAKYLDNADLIVRALDEIPKESQGRYPAQIRSDPAYSELNARLSGLFARSRELQAEWDTALEKALYAGTQSDQDIAILKQSIMRNMQSLPESGLHSELMTELLSEFASSQRLTEAHRFPAIKQPAKQLMDADSVTVRELRQFIVETRANLGEVLLPAFTDRVSEFFAAQRSVAEPLQQLLVAAANGTPTSDQPLH